MSQKKYITPAKLSVFLDNLKKLFATKSDVDSSINEVKSDIPQIQFITLEPNEE